MHVYCIRSGWPSIVIVKFGQMNILTHENVTMYGGVMRATVFAVLEDRYAI